MAWSVVSQPGESAATLLAELSGKHGGQDGPRELVDEIRTRVSTASLDSDDSEELFAALSKEAEEAIATGTAAAAAAAAAATSAAAAGADNEESEGKSGGQAATAAAVPTTVVVTVFRCARLRRRDRRKLRAKREKYVIAIEIQLTETLLSKRLSVRPVRRGRALWRGERPHRHRAQQPKPVV